MDTGADVGTVVNEKTGNDGCAFIDMIVDGTAKDNNDVDAAADTASDVTSDVTDADRGGRGRRRPGVEGVDAGEIGGGCGRKLLGQGEDNVM